MNIEKEEKLAISSENADIICLRLKESSDSESRDIISRAGQEAGALLATARAEALKSSSEDLSKAQKEAESLKERILSEANLQKKKIFLEEKSRLADSVFAEVKKLAVSFRQDPEYPVFLKDSVLRGARILEDNSLEIVFSAADSQLLNADFRAQIIRECGNVLGADVKLIFSEVESSDIGLIVRTHNGSRIYDGRFLRLLQQRYDEFYVQIIREMF